MGIIQCAEDCRFQIDGYCNLDKCSNVNSLENSCPHYISRLTDNRKCLSKISNTNKFD